jgi:hypothetical protein
MKHPEVVHKGSALDPVIGGVAAEEQVSGFSVVSAVSAAAFDAVSATALFPRNDPEIPGITHFRKPLAAAEHVGWSSVVDFSPTRST